MPSNGFYFFSSAKLHFPRLQSVYGLQIGFKLLNRNVYSCEWICECSDESAMSRAVDNRPVSLRWAHFTFIQSPEPVKSVAFHDAGWLTYLISLFT